jgi:hypothetical protein
MPLSYHRMVAWPWILLWELGWLTLLIWGVWQLRQFHRHLSPLGYGLDWVIAGLGIVLALSSLFSDFRQVAIQNASLVITYGIGLYIYRNWLSAFKVPLPEAEGFRERANPAVRHSLWFFLVAVATVTAIISLILWQPDAAMWRSSSFYEALRNHQPLGHHNFVGGYFALLLPLAVAGAVALNQRLKQPQTAVVGGKCSATLEGLSNRGSGSTVGGQGPPYSSSGLSAWLPDGLGMSGRFFVSLIVVLPAGLMLLALYASGSRGALLGCLLWLLLTWLCLMVRASAQQRWRWSLSGLAGAVVAALGLATNPRIRTWFSTLFNGSSQPFTITDGPTLDRWFMLQQGINILRDRPLLGVGPGVMSRVSNLYRPIETGTGLDHIQQLHNTPMQIAGELGLAGILLVFAGILLLGRLSWRLWQQPLSGCDRTLLGGIIGSFTAYGIASLTDYQLENIPISATLLILVLLLLDLADNTFAPNHHSAQDLSLGQPFPDTSSIKVPQPPILGEPELQNPPLIHPSTHPPIHPSTHPPIHPSTLPKSLRRILSLSLWAWFGLVLCIWLPFTLTIYFTDRADHAFRNAEISAAESNWYKASRLSPWDPTAAAVASQKLFELRQMMGESDVQGEIQTLMLDYGAQAQQAAPNDVWFNQNLAVMYLQVDPEKALPFAIRAVQLLPRNLSHSYFLLGQLFLAQGQLSEAKAAFTLEALVQPAILMAPVWQQPPLQPLYPDVLAATLEEYDQLLQQVSSDASQYKMLYETRALVAWWAGQRLPQEQQQNLSPVTRLLVVADTNPQLALRQIEQYIVDGRTSAPMYLLAAWLDPDKYWSAYTSHPNALPQSELAALQESLSQRQLRHWLTSLAINVPVSGRVALGFAYRSAQAQNITQILKPQGLELSTLVTALDLFQLWPRDFPALDHHIEQIRTRTLGLAHPTYGKFRLEPAKL